MKAHFYNTEEEAKAVCHKISDTKGLPIPGNYTMDWCEPIKCEGGWCIPEDDVTKEILGEGIEVEIKVPAAYAVFKEPVVIDKEPTPPPK